MPENQKNTIATTEFEFFDSPTKGRLSFENLVGDIVTYINEQPKNKYQIVVGTDSPGIREPDFVTAIVVRRVGYGGRYFYQRSQTQKFHQPLSRERIYFEVMRSVNVALALTEKLKIYFDILPKVKTDGDVSVSYHFSIDFQVHIDVGENGPTKDMVKEVVGMVRGYGFDARMKPESYGASTIADRHT